MASTPRPDARPAAAAVDDQTDHIERALDALRREWKSGFNGRMVGMLAIPSLRRLRDLVATQFAADELADIERCLRAYDDLPVEQRKLTLVEVASRIKSLSPDVQIGTTPAPEVGKLREALVAPKPKPRATPPRQAGIKPLPPDAPVTELPRVGNAVAGSLAKLHVATVRDLLDRAPRRHIDYSRTVKIGNILGFGARDDVTIQGEILDIKEVPGPGSPRVTVRLADDTGWVRVTWFNSYLGKQLHAGMRIAISGTPDTGYGALSFTNPEWERGGMPALSTGRLTPVYPLTAGLAQKSLRTLTRAALDATATTLHDPLPGPIRAALDLLPLTSAYEGLHYPPSWSQLEAAQRRLAFDNLLVLQLGLLRKRNERTAVRGVAIAVDRSLLDRFTTQLPFRLTNAQQRALGEVLADLERGQPMARLLQGDVGSGKTAVAAAVATLAHASGFQTAVMAPTEILAEQHFHNFRGLTSGLSAAEQPEVALLTGSTRAKERRDLLAALAAQEIDILVGTHALIQDPVEFAQLGLTIIDEQHRFGVRQRAHLPTRQGDAMPHVLSMTATPIPRSLNMVLNGDLDVSVIDELPPGRIPVETRRFVGAERDLAYDLVRQEVAKGHQVFVICPLVEESEASDAKAAVAEAARLRADVFPELRIATLHGRMKGREKDAIMTAFRDREFDILVSTSVIEVGIDVPNATVMLIEGADRFGLAQLHQFRGRVGRGGSRSYCLLLADETSPDGEARLDLMVETNDGFVLAEKDLELRGPGDFLGTRQSGLPEMSWIDGSFDTRLLDLARQTAIRILERDPALALPEHAELNRRFRLVWEKGVAPVTVPS